MNQKDLLPHLFRTEYRKIISVLCKLFGIEYIGIAEDIASDTFLMATETWGQKGLPENPTAWLYVVAKNKAKDYLKHHAVFNKKVAKQIRPANAETPEIEIDLSEKNITDSQLQMMFAICHPYISVETQIALSLRILCGFGIDEIADAFLTNKETIKKRLLRGKEKLRQEKVPIAFPKKDEINNRLDAVIITLYLLFTEGYSSSKPGTVLRKELCLEAMRLTYFLIENKWTNQPSVNALLSLMCFHASRLEARTNQKGEIILYHDQDETLWDNGLIAKGEYYLNQASQGNKISKFHLEAGIAYWHTIKADTKEKWENILQLYNQLLQIEYSPMAALNRTYALSKARGKAEAIIEAEKLNLVDKHLYHSLLGELYIGIDNAKAISHFETGITLAKSQSDKAVMGAKIDELRKSKSYECYKKANIRS
ncbi:MAG: sigma-70 family RNA polymerase sigma factor [Ginsengibacter sp.]